MDFLNLMKNCKVIFTDSGGFKKSQLSEKPCYTLRYNTERPITLSKGTNKLVDPEKNKIVESFNK